MQAVAPEDWIGRVLDGRYEVLEPLGEGGMGSVFVARHMRLERKVAVKIVRPEQVGDADTAARFAREATVTSRIDHPNVISAIDYGTLDNGSAFFAMQLVLGPSLRDVIEAERTLHWSRAAVIFAQVADALAAARAHGIVHRDLKPENILLQRGESGGELVKVLDFGIAKFERDSLAPPPAREQQRVTQMGIVIGTPGYMAPEQAVGKHADHRADLYALGVLLWESITGMLLWDEDDVQELIRRQLSERAPSVRDAADDLTIPDELEELVARLLEVDPKKRPETAIEVRDTLLCVGDALPRSGAHAIDPRLQQRLSRTGQVTRKSGVGHPTGTQVDNDQDLDTRTTQAIAPSKRWNARKAVLGAVALACATLAGALWVRTDAQSRPLTDRPPEAAAGEDAQEGSELTDTAGEPALPEHLEPALRQLIEGESREARMEGARTLLAHVPMNEVPAYARGMAYLQVAVTCRDKRDVLDRLAVLQDPRTLPALLELSGRPRRGCGPKNRRDCLGCMRSSLNQLIADLTKQPIEDG